MKITVPYGTGQITAEVPETVALNLVEPPVQPYAQTPEQLIGAAMENPIGSAKLEELAASDARIVIVVNDHTRPGPNALMVQHVMQRLEAADVADENIRFVIATGSHRATTHEELEQILGPIYLDRIAVHVHDCRDRESLHYLGESKDGVPIWLNKYVAQADLVITTGVITPHHSAGFSGGRKSILPGVAGLETLKIHHSLPIRPFHPAMGRMEDNPFHHVSLEVAKQVKVGFIVNAVQDLHKKDIAFVAGGLEEAHRQGVAICREANLVPFDQPGDVVVVSPGGAPRDKNLYQAQKALSVAEALVRPGGTMILCAKAEEGIGEGVFRQWLEEASTPEEVVERFRREGYDVGSNKAFMYARALTKGRVIIVTDQVSKEELSAMMLEWAPDLQTALDETLKQGETVIVLPRAVNIIPGL